MWRLGLPWQYWDMWNVGKDRRHWNYFSRCNTRMCNQMLLLLSGFWMHVLTWLHLSLKHVDFLMSKFAAMDGIQISLWRLTWWTCIQSVGALRMLGVCSTRCHIKMWSWYWDMWNVAKGRRCWNYFEKCNREGVQPNFVIFVGVLKTCVNIVVIEEGMCVHQ